MKSIKETARYIFLIALSLFFLYSCASLDQQKQQETKKPSSVSEEAKPTPKEEPQEVKEQPKKSPAVHKKQRELKPALRELEPKTSPADQTESHDQKKYYYDGMRFYTQAKYHEAKAAWQEVINKGPKTKLAAKARKYILKADQKLKYLEQMK
jgi:TolA-binding protein